MGNADELRATIAMLREEGLLDRLRSVSERGLSFYPPRPPEMSQAERDIAAERASANVAAWEQRIARGAAGGIRNRDTIPAPPQGRRGV